MLRSQIRPYRLRQVTNIRLIHKHKKPSKSSQDVQSEKQVDYKYVPYMKTFNMLTNATKFEAKHTDIDEIHPPTKSNKVSKRDWVKDLEQRKQEREKVTKELDQRAKNPSQERKTQRNDYKKKENKQNTNREIRRDYNKDKPIKPRAIGNINDKKGRRVFGNA